MKLVAVGGVCGFAWACGLRGAMAALSGPESSVTWAGTFAWILLPGLLVGALLGWGEQRRQSGNARGRGWFVASPLLFSAVLFSGGVAGLAQFLQDGLGGGALAVPLFGMLGGYALSHRGPLWTRMLAGIVLLAPIPAAVVMAATASSVTPHGVWVGAYFYSFILVLAFACAIPHLPVRGSDAPNATPAAAVPDR